MIYKVALIGYGYWGPKLARNFLNSNNFEISCIVDKSLNNLNKAKQIFPTSKFYQNHKMINVNEIDLVVICTPTEFHYEMAKFFLKTNHVLVEKPLSLNMKKVVELETLSKKNDKLLFVDYPFIFSGSINFIYKIIKNKKFGKLLEIESFREQAPIRNDANVVWDLGVHDISILKYLLDSNPIKIRGLKYNTEKIKMNDTAYINLFYKNNLKVFIKNSWISPIKIRFIKFKFHKAIITCDENEPIYKIKIYKKNNKLSTKYKLEIPDIDISEPLYNLVNYIYKCIKKKRNPIFKKSFNIAITQVLEKI